MNRVWWQLPGPAQFVSAIAEDLRDGKNVFVSLPKHVPVGLSSAIRSALTVDQEIQWYRVRPDNSPPLDFLFSHFDGLDRGSGLERPRTASLLANHEKLGNKIIWLDDLKPSQWEQWWQFFTEYGQASQHSLIWNRPKFVVPLTGSLATLAIEDPSWSQYLWRGVVSGIDMLLFTSHMLQERPFTQLQKRVVTSVIAKISLWDPNLCQRLVTAKFEDILQPREILQRLATERNWPEEYCTDNLSWQEGMIDLVDKKWMTHSAMLARAPSQSEIDRRIWSAEMSILLPLVEEGRQEIIASCRANLRLPWTADRNRTIDDPYNLEINHIRSQIHRGIANLDLESQRLAYELTEIRNLLSHLRTVPLDLLDSEVLNRFVEQQLEREILSSPDGLDEL